MGHGCMASTPLHRELERVGLQRSVVVARQQRKHVQGTIVKLGDTDCSKLAPKSDLSRQPTGSLSDI